MTKDQILEILFRVPNKKAVPLPEPTNEEWEVLEAFFDSHFSQTFKNFIELMAIYDTSLEVYSGVAFDEEQKKHYHAIGIQEVYESEIAENREGYEWPPEMIPFAGIGNGDVLCVSISDKNMPVFCVEHGQRTLEKLSVDFDTWLTEWEF